MFLMCEDQSSTWRLLPNSLRFYSRSQYVRRFIVVEQVALCLIIQRPSTLISRTSIPSGKEFSLDLRLVFQRYFFWLCFWFVVWRFNLSHLNGTSENPTPTLKATQPWRNHNPMPQEETKKQGDDRPTWFLRI